jgi:hypothetical protein
LVQLTISGGKKKTTDRSFTLYKADFKGSAPILIY